MTETLTAADPPGPAGSVEDLRATDLGDYLRLNNWSVLPAAPGLQTWVHGDRPTRDEVIKLPVDTSFSDYSENLRIALRQLARLNDWDAQQLFTNVLAVRSDMFFVRAAQFTQDASIPVLEAQQLLNGAVSIATAAARSTYHPRRSFQGRLPDRVREFVDDDLRMGHTRRGSFVITLLTRLDFEDSDEATAEPELGAKTKKSTKTAHERLGTDQIAPFQRRVMNTLATGLSYVHSATQQAQGSKDPAAAVDLDAAAAAGVSAQLCQALGEMTDQEGVSQLDLSFKWAPVDATRVEIDRVVFDRPVAPILFDLSERLAPTPPQERRASVTGHVIRLERGLDKEEGAVTVEGFADTGERRTVRIVLAGERYTAAVAAHEAQGLVEATGQLVCESRTYFLRGDVTIRRMTAGLQQQ